MHPSRLRFFAAAAVPLLAAGASPARPTDPIPPVTHPEALIPWIRQAATGRADIVCLGDSNQLHQSTGWDYGWIRALEERFGLYATGLLAPGENSCLGAGSGHQYNVAGTASSGQFTCAGAPPALNRRMSPSVGMSPFNYLYLASGQAGDYITHGLFIDRFSSLDVNGPLRFHLIYGAFSREETGSFQIAVRQAAPPYSTLFIDALRSTSTFEGGEAVHYSVDLPAAPRDAHLNFRFSPWTQNLTGPFLAYYVRLENIERTRGASLHTLYAYGGQSARDMAAALFAADDEYLTLFFEQVRALQGPEKKILVRINSGMNDRGETEPSIISGITPGNSPLAFADNLEGIMLRIQGIWMLNNWPQEELFFLLTPSHPIWNPDSYQLIQYREQASWLASKWPRTAAVNFGALTAWGELIANQWYANVFYDFIHLSPAGFEALAARELDAIEDGACWHDLNSDGAIDIEDLHEWYILRPDLNGDGLSDYVDARCLQQAIRSGEQADLADSRPGPPFLP